MLKTIRLATVVALMPLLSACDQLIELLELPNPKKEAAMATAEGEAIGSACRHAGRSLEDCYLLNPGAHKAAIFSGWRSMNDYMMENKLEVVPSQLQPKAATQPAAEAQAQAPATPAKAGAH